MRKPKTKTKKSNIEAIAAYENGQLIARDLLQAIRELLDAMPHPDGAEVIHWGHVGDLSHVNDLLSEIACFLTGTDEADL